MMKKAMEVSTPRIVEYGQWHLPLVTIPPRGIQWEIAKKICVSRCARVSFDKHTDTEPLTATMDRYYKLLDSGHLSPFEHAAKPMKPSAYINPEKDFLGNLRGWISHRREIPFEYDFSLMQKSMEHNEDDSVRSLTSP